MDRRTFMRAVGVTGTSLVMGSHRDAIGYAAHRVTASGGLAGSGDHVPQTGFEQRAGSSWTTHDEELDFLMKVAVRSARIAVDVIGESVEGRPLHLIRIGDPKAPATSRKSPTLLLISTQHGNEPASRETMLITLRDLAFTNDPVLVEQMRDRQILIVPTANPDGRHANTRENAAGVDTNRDHIGLTQPETQAIHAAVRDWDPDVVVDHHEYYKLVVPTATEDVLYMWPRNLNVDPVIRGLSRSLCEGYVAQGARHAGYTADEFAGTNSFGRNTTHHYTGTGYNNYTGTGYAGGPEENICRNAMGLRHSVSMLIESGFVLTSFNDTVPNAEDNLHRVAVQMQVVRDTLRFHREHGETARSASSRSAAVATQVGADRSRPTYWGGADHDDPSPDQIDKRPPCRYELTHGQADELASVLALHGIQVHRLESSAEVSLAQPARPVIPLLLDQRASWSMVEGNPRYDNCG